MKPNIITRLGPAVRIALVGAFVALGTLTCSACAESPARHGSPHTQAAVAKGPASKARKVAKPLRRADVWAVGDGAIDTPAAHAVAEQISKHRINKLLYLGDVYPTGSAADFEHNYRPTYGRFARITAPTPGNHEWPNHLTGYNPYWQRVFHKPIAPWYAFKIAGWEILSLNSEAPHRRGSEQLRWLHRTVRPAGTCRIAIWHRPRFSAGAEHGDQNDMSALWDELDGKASIVISGHEHGMQRFKPIDGITEFVSGSGGNKLYGIHSDPWLAFGNSTSHGALRLILRPKTANFQFVDTAGRVLDSGRIRCRTR